MSFRDQTIESFLGDLSSKTPIPGGGGASALVGALSCALTHMVGALTVGKQKYAAVEEEMTEPVRAHGGYGDAFSDAHGRGRGRI
ncbi:MAG: cyclodeaminase/cyclohydrolase family protein [Eubacteriales bacterium]